MLGELDRWLRAARTRAERPMSAHLTRPVAIPDDVDDPSFEKESGTVELPLHVRWSHPPRSYDLDDPRQRRLVYEQGATMAKKTAKPAKVRSMRSSQQALQRMLDEALKLPGVKEAEALARNVPTVATPTLVPAAGYATGGNADAE